MRSKLPQEQNKFSCSFNAYFGDDYAKHAILKNAKYSRPISYHTERKNATAALNYYVSNANKLSEMRKQSVWHSKQKSATIPHSFRETPMTSPIGEFIIKSCKFHAKPLNKKEILLSVYPKWKAGLCRNIANLKAKMYLRALYNKLKRAHRK